jgi:hypothetical protein
MNDHPHGYRPDLENVEHLVATSRPRDWAQLYSASCDRPLDGRIREKIKSQIVIEGQGRTNSCGGHAGSTIVEFNRWLECEQLDQRSRWAAYIWGQDECGIETDSGVQIDGLCRALSSKGLCEDRLWRFTGAYHRTPPGGAEALRLCLENAAECKLTSWEVLRGGYAGIAQWLQTGQGGIVAAVPWYTNWYSGVGEVLPAPNGSASGYHAYPLLWLTDRRQGSRYYVEGPNSWAASWGKAGWAEWSPTLIDWLATQRGTLFVGLSDLDGVSIKPRDVNRRTSWFAK